jgi:two-component system, OmpR family, KDP operon response regulator KdpE
VEHTTVHGTVLVVEDDPTMVEILHIFLEDSGCRILEARLGRDAVEIAAAERPDVITLDLGLPDMDGREVLRQLQSAADWDPSIIVVTGRHFEPQPGERVMAVLMKPFDAAELEEIVSRALASAERLKPAGYAQ